MKVSLSRYAIYIVKFLRYTKIYGFRKTLFKSVGRSRSISGFFKPRIKNALRDVAVVGCGQFSFSTLGYSLCKSFGNRFIDCYDIDKAAHDSFAEFYSIYKPSQTYDDLLSNPNVKYVYVTSNHASHSDYAVRAMMKGKVVYVEKPIAVNYDQLRSLLCGKDMSGGIIYAGYNRPFSKAILDLKKIVGVKKEPMTLNCFVSGHKIDLDHWYRDPSEGTRVCGNIGHWIDLSLHILSWGYVPDRWMITLSYSNSDIRDDDLSISMVSESGDLINIVMTSRCEPFEGINENINLQCGYTIAKIDDFRRMVVWKGEKLISKRYWPKDVGHNLSLLQPFVSSNARDWDEVVFSTLMMLFIADMVRTGQSTSEFSFSEVSDKYI
ncbi:Gfo/Idh/MocA family protein [Prosthecochloris sp. HL-130-GSB]|uniref:Gfo/Idh/MocA family protein n=1 Tax=Prosthecochloris sp. HL-130-GSB TaxID=1974213 RepID=UPI000A1C0ED7|nr:Gfo/Idh/MocA family oxidoreductase [Prosthecochloris sp. HL-130-GSB]ARM31353.1 hypothetical protein B9H02_08690 [Prosthecochloris sp. HL-130-GSB]